VVKRDNLYTLNEFGELLNKNGYEFDLKKSYKDNGLIDEILYPTRKPKLFNGVQQKNGLSVIFKFNGVATVTLFDPNEKNVKLNTVTINIPVNGYFIDREGDVFFQGKDCLRSYDSYDDLLLGFDDYIETLDNSDGKGFDWLKKRYIYDLKVIYCINLNEIDSLLNNVKILLNKNSVLYKENSSTERNKLNCEQLPIQRTAPNVENLNTEITQLRKVVMDKTKNIEELQERIAKLEPKEMQYSNNQNAITDAEINLTNNDLVFLAALIKMLSNEKRAYTQSKILEMIEDNHEGIKGLSKSRTEKVLAAANKIYKPLITNKIK